MAMMAVRFLRENIEQFQRARLKRKVLRALAGEVRCNIEQAHVMFQQKTRRAFLTRAWAVAAAVLDLDHPDWQAYQEKLFLYNTALEDLTQYRVWYAEDIARQSRDNARVLDEKWEKVESLFPGILAVLLQAEQHVHGKREGRSVC